MSGHILKELRAHAPFTAFGAITGIVVMVFSVNLSYKISYNIFYILHPFHVFLSALVTAAMYKLHTCQKIGMDCIKGKCNLRSLIIIGYVGSIGIATLSDSIIPYLAEILLNMPKREIHLGFIEKWWLVNPLALMGIAFAYYHPTTKFPHGLHVLLSTWASLFHMIMAGIGILDWVLSATIFVFLFIAVWVPCCVSDIVFPLLFTKNK